MHDTLNQRKRVHIGNHLYVEIDYAITVKMAEDYWQTVGKDGKTARKDPAKKRKRAQGFQPSVLEPAGMCLKTCNHSILRNTLFFRVFTYKVTFCSISTG